jgi:hypothetical protein
LSSNSWSGNYGVFRCEKTGVFSIIDQVDSVQPTVTPSKMPWDCEEVVGVMRLQTDGFHLPAMNNQEIQDVDGAVSGIVELDQARNVVADTHSLQDLTTGHLVGAHDPDSMLSLRV